MYAPRGPHVDTRQTGPAVRQLPGRPGRERVMRAMRAGGEWADYRRIHRRGRDAARSSPRGGTNRSGVPLREKDRPPWAEPRNPTRESPCWLAWATIGMTRRPGPSSSSITGRRSTGGAGIWGLQDADAQDVTQHVLLKLFDGFRDFRYEPGRSFRRGSRRITHHAWHDYLKARQRPGQGTGDSSILRLVANVEAREDLSVRLQDAFDRDLLDEAIARVRLRIEPRTWDAFRLLSLDDWSGAQAAQHLGMKVATVFVSRGKVLRMIREEVDRLLRTSRTVVLAEGESVHDRLSPRPRPSTDSSREELAGAELATIVEHVEACTDCQNALDRLGGSTRSRRSDCSEAVGAMPPRPACAAASPSRRTGPVEAVAVSPDGKIILTGMRGCPWRSGRRRAGQALGRRHRRAHGTESPHSDAVKSVAFSPDGKTVLTGCYDAMARLWDRETGRHLGVPQPHNYPVLAAAFSPDGKTVVSGGGRSSSAAGEGEVPALGRGHRESPGRSPGAGHPHPPVAFRPDGALVATAPETAGSGSGTRRHSARSASGPGPCR